MLGTSRFVGSRASFTKTYNGQAIQDVVQTKSQNLFFRRTKPVLPNGRSCEVPLQVDDLTSLRIVTMLCVVATVFQFKILPYIPNMTMKLALLASLIASAAAFAPAQNGGECRQ